MADKCTEYSNMAVVALSGVGQVFKGFFNPLMQQSVCHLLLYLI